MHLDYLSEDEDRESAARIDRQNLHFSDMKTDNAKGAIHAQHLSLKALRRQMPACVQLADDRWLGMEDGCSA